MTEKCYIAIDGDDVGRSIERLVLLNDGQGLSDFSTKYRCAIRWLTSVLIDSLQGTALLSDGDSILMEVHTPSYSADKLAALSKEFVQLSGHTVSIGIGDTMRRAYLALKLAKLSGKNQIRHYKELIE